jgi:hypothetical protein
MGPCVLWTGFGIEDGGTGTLAAARERFIDNELLDRDYGKYHELFMRRTPVTTLHRETHGEPDRSNRYRGLVRSLGFASELRAVFRTGGACWGSVALVRDQAGLRGVGGRRTPGPVPIRGRATHGWSWLAHDTGSLGPVSWRRATLEANESL